MSKGPREAVAVGLVKQLPIRDAIQLGQTLLSQC